jgi:hypothetical protein
MKSFSISIPKCEVKSQQKMMASMLQISDTQVALVLSISSWLAEIECTVHLVSVDKKE